MRIVTWNINSVKARGDRLLAWLDRHSPDVLCLQELKVKDEFFPEVEVRGRGYHTAVFGQKTYNGVAILSKAPIEDVHRGLEDEVDDPQSRLISGRIDGVHVICAYFPNGGRVGSDKYEYKLEWMKRLRGYLDRRFDPHVDQVALCGDYNVAPFDDDVARAEEWGDGVLCNDAVRGALDEIAAFGLSDTFRPFHPDGRIHTWWDYRGMGFDRGNGLRIDHIFATPPLAARAIGAAVDRAERHGKGASDHAPVIVEFE